MELQIKKERSNFGNHYNNLYRKSNFAKLNTEALFDAVDFDKSGDITEEEWMAFWEIVKENGYSEEEINMEVKIRL